MADGGFEPKTVEDYRDIVKILKVKVIKQTKYIQELEKKVRESENQIQENKRSAKFENIPMADSSSFPTMSKDFDTQNLKNKSIVMYLFKKSAEKMGLNLEGIFRYADYTCSGELDCDEFRNTLSKMSLGLTPKQISCLIYIFDQDCNGLITRNDYHNSLKAYVVSQQEKSRHYNNDCLLRITQLFSQKKVQAQNFFEEMRRSNKVVDINIFGELVRKKFSRQLQEREIVGAFNQIDFESQGVLEKESFSYSMRAYLAKPRDRSRTPVKTPQRTEEKFYPEESKFSNKKSDAVKPQPSKTIQDFNDKQPEHAKPNVEISKQISSVLMQLTKETKQTSTQLFTRILDHQFHAPITMNVFKRLLQQDSQQVSNKLALGLFRQIDRQQKGSFDLNRMFQFCAQNQKDPSLLLNILAKHFNSRFIDSAQFMSINELKEDATINRKQFMDLFTYQLNIEERFLDGLWSHFNKNGSGNVTVSNIIKQIAVYQLQ